MLKLADYNVHPQTGFLPSESPLTHLPAAYDVWEDTAAHLSALVMTGRVRSSLEAMPLLDVEQLTDNRQRERAMLMLCFFAGAYVWGMNRPAKRLPASIAVPLWQVAESLGRPPIINHASLVLNNWQKLNPDGGLDADNLDTTLTLLGGMDEKWFYLATVGVEYAGAPLIPLMVAAQSHVTDKSITAVTDLLGDMLPILKDTYAALDYIQAKCDPYIFYHRVRPYLAGWEAPGLIYEGISETPQVFMGGSAAQSSLIQAIDAVFGIRHTHEHSAPFLLEMRDYMPPLHREFIESLESRPSLHDFVETHQPDYPTLLERFNACVTVIDRFRQKHMEIAVRYISHQARDVDDAKGTGGTDFVQFLSAARKETKAHLMDNTKVSASEGEF